MAGYKETPRQKMIGMMYLVLTALLALNVSKDILNAFVIVNKGLQTSQVNTSAKNDRTYYDFENAAKNNAGKVKPFLDKAYKARNLSSAMARYIRTLGIQLIAYTDLNIPKDLKDSTVDQQKWAEAKSRFDTLSLVESRDNYDKAMEILIGQNESDPNGEALTLKNKLEEYKTNMLALLKSPDLDKDKTFEKNFPINTNPIKTPDEGVVSWINGNFHHTVLVADEALLNKMLIDVKTVESEVITRLFSAVDAGSFKFDTLVAKVVAKSNYLLSGAEYRANIFVAAMDTKKDPDIFIGDTITHADGKRLDKFDHGMGVYTDAGGIGEHKYTGWISVLKPGETTPRIYNFSSSYIIAPPSATVSADKMNVFYIGVINPVTVSVPGAANDKVHPVISSGGTMVPKGNGHYDVSVTAGCPSNKVTVSVMADMDGKPSPMGSSDFRVKRVPDPIAMIANQTGGVISKTVLAAAGAIIPTMKDFDFNLNFVIKSFTMTINLHGDLIEIQSPNNQLTSDMVKKLQSAPTGTKVYLENIKAAGPDGSYRTLSSINLKLSN